MAGSDAQLAETLAGPIQTLFRIDAGPDAYLELFARFAPTHDIQDLAARVHERVRQLRGALEGDAVRGPDGTYLARVVGAAPLPWWRLPFSE